MDHHIPPPQVGSRLRVSWGAAVAECCNAMRQIGAGGLVRSGPSGIGQEALPANHRDRRGGGVIEPDRGCWNFTTEDRETGEYDEEGNPITETATVFGNQYMMLGDVLQQYDLSTTVDELAEKAFASDEEEPTEEENPDEGEEDEDTKVETGHVYICLRHNATGSNTSEDEPYLEGYPTWDELHTAQIDLNWHTIPIYLLEVVRTTKTVDETDENGDPTGSTTEETTTTYSIKCDFRKGIFAQQAEIIGSLSSSGGTEE